MFAPCCGRRPNLDGHLVLLAELGAGGAQPLAQELTKLSGPLTRLLTLDSAYLPGSDVPAKVLFPNPQHRLDALLRSGINMAQSGSVVIVQAPWQGLFPQAAALLSQASGAHPLHVTTALLARDMSEIAQAPSASLQHLVHYGALVRGAPTLAKGALGSVNEKGLTRLGQALVKAGQDPIGTEALAQFLRPLLGLVHGSTSAHLAPRMDFDVVLNGSSQTTPKLARTLYDHLSATQHALRSSNLPRVAEQVRAVAPLVGSNLLFSGATSLVENAASSVQKSAEQAADATLDIVGDNQDLIIALGLIALDNAPPEAKQKAKEALARMPPKARHQLLDKLPKETRPIAQAMIDEIDGKKGKHKKGSKGKKKHSGKKGKKGQKKSSGSKGKGKKKGSGHKKTSHKKKHSSGKKHSGKKKTGGKKKKHHSKKGSDSSSDSDHSHKKKKKHSGKGKKHSHGTASTCSDGGVVANALAGGHHHHHHDSHPNKPQPPPASGDVINDTIRLPRPRDPESCSNTGQAECMRFEPKYACKEWEFKGWRYEGFPCPQQQPQPPAKY